MKLIPFLQITEIFKTPCEMLSNKAMLTFKYASLLCVTIKNKYFYANSISSGLVALYTDTCKYNEDVLVHVHVYIYMASKHLLLAKVNILPFLLHLVSG